MMMMMMRAADKPTDDDGWSVSKLQARTATLGDRSQPPLTSDPVGCWLSNRKMKAVEPMEMVTSC